MESFFASLKTERVHEARLRTRAEARAAVFEYIEVFYNRQRLHSALGYRTPAEARASTGRFKEGVFGGDKVEVLIQHLLIEADQEGGYERCS
jgi:hypothetical protein